MMVSDALRRGSDSVGKAALTFGKKVANNPVRALEIASKTGCNR